MESNDEKRMIAEKIVGERILREKEKEYGERMVMREKETDS
ncbi:hypothetical protein [Saccharibacillus sacchari]|uniref:Uncharacterized protein n=1 Tax=Saccharibacillus sacchari TaxID=456493 RepID=A0ACC6PHU2_9BACL